MGMSTKMSLFVRMFSGCRIIILAFSLLVSGAAVHAGALAAGGGAKFVAGELLVQFNAGVSAEKAKGLIASNGATSINEIEQIRVRRIRVPEQAREHIMAALANNKNVSFVEMNFIAEVVVIPNDTKYPSQWHLPKIDAPSGWEVTTGSSSMPIAIIDTGVDSTHPDLVSKLVPGHNFLTGTNDTADTNGHGTYIAGSAAASSNNLEGVAGVAWRAPIMPLIAADSTGYAAYSNIASAIIYAVEAGVRVINISIAGSSNSYTLQNAVNYAWSRGCLVFAAAGNAGSTTPMYPAACENVVAVGATSNTDTLAIFSSRGDWLDVVAPGVSVLTTSRGGGYASVSGTSIATPLASGLAALILSVNPNFAAADVLNLITGNTNDLGEAGFDPFYGYGRINVNQSLIAAQTVSSNADMIPPTVSVTEPEANAVLAGIVTVGAAADDNSAVDSVEFYLDGGLIGTSFIEPHRFSWNTSEVPDGEHTLTAVAEDTSGNLAVSAPVIVTVQNTREPDPVPEPTPEPTPVADTTPPVVQLKSPTDGSTLSSKATVSASGADDESGVVMMRVFVDGSLMTEQAKASITWNWNLRKVSKGVHTVTAQAVDGAGNAGEVSVTVFVK